MTTPFFKSCPSRPDLDEMMRKSKEWFDALSLDQQREHRKAQRKSWVIGELMLEHPEMTREEAEESYQRNIVDKGF